MKQAFGENNSECDNTIFDWSLKYDGSERKREHRSDFQLADFCRGEDLSEE